MGNCMRCTCPMRRYIIKRDITLAIVGLDNAGKTVTTVGLQGAPLDTVVPTIGFSKVQFTRNEYGITLYDLGGGKNIRDIWKNYYAEVHGLIYVVDAADHDRMAETKKVLSALLQDVRIAGKPVLLLVNKQDIKDAMDDLDVIYSLDLEKLVNRNECPCKVESCSATNRRGKRVDKSIRSGLDWLLWSVDVQWEKLSKRIEIDVQEQIEREKLERKRRLEVVRQAREERDEKEKAEKQLRGDSPVTLESSDATDFSNGNPFKRLDIEEIESKQAKLKRSKLKSSKEVVKKLSVSPPCEAKDLEKPAPKSSSTDSPNLASPQWTPEGPQWTPEGPVDPVSKDPLGKEDVETIFASKSPWLKKRSPRPSTGKESVLSGFFNDDLDIEGDGATRCRNLMPATLLRPLESVGRPRRKKKKRARRNQISPNEDSSLKSDTDSITSSETAPNNVANDVNSNPHKTSCKPRLEVQLEEEEPEPVSFAQRWGLVDNLPDMQQDTSSYRRFRPNMDSGDNIIT